MKPLPTTLDELYDLIWPLTRLTTLRHMKKKLRPEPLNTLPTRELDILLKLLKTGQYSGPRIRDKTGTVQPLPTWYIDTDEFAPTQVRRRKIQFAEQLVITSHPIVSE